MKSKLCYLLFGVFSITMTSCETDTDSNSNSNSAEQRLSASTLAAPVNDLTPCASSELIAGEQYDAGDIKVYFDATNVYIEYQTSANWYLRKTYLYVGDQRLIPLTRLGNPRFEFFPINETLPENSHTAIYTIAKSNLKKCFVVSAYAEVYHTDSNGDIDQIENAWSLGERYNADSLGMYFDVCQTDCSN